VQGNPDELWLDDLARLLRQDTVVRYCPFFILLTGVAGIGEDRGLKQSKTSRYEYVRTCSLIVARFALVKRSRIVEAPTYAVAACLLVS
jgi:hypothetical protein